MAAPRNTPATLLLARRGVAFTVHSYEVTSEEATYGESVAAALGIPARRLFKILVAQVGREPVVAIVPTDRSLSLKRLAAAVGGKRAQMVDRATAERLTGYSLGGISPFGQKRALPVFVDGAIEGLETVFVSAGLRGLQVEVAPRDLISLLEATVGRLTEPDG